MTAWISAAPALLIAVAAVTIPGAGAAWMLRFRGLTMVAASIAASISVIALASILSPMIGVQWGILPVLATAAVLTALLIPVRLLTRRLRVDSSTTKASASWTTIAVVVSGGLIGVALMRAIGLPENISQTYDGVFHINAAAHILLNGDASPFHMDLARPGLTGGFYPTVWHALVALVAQLSGASIPVSTNAIALTTSAWIWPVAILFFSRPFFVRRPAHLILGAILAANFTAFPYLLLAWGVLYPNLLSTALIPIALGFVYAALRHNVVHSLSPLVSLWIAALGAIGAAVLAHPNALFGIAAFTVPMILVTANDVRRSALGPITKALRWGGLALTIVAFVVMWSLVSTSDNSRGYGKSLASAFLDGISNAQMLETRAWFLTVLVLGGVVVLLVLRQHRWLILSYAVALGLFVISSGLEGSIRDIFTGAWYNDAHRLAALLPIGAIPLAGAAAARLLDYVTAGIENADPERISERVRKFLPAIGALIVFALVLTGSRGQNLAIQTGWIAELHNPAGSLLSEDERTLLDRLPDDVPADAIIAGDPWTGTGLALAISQRNVLFAHLKGSYNVETRELGTDFIDLGASACPLLTDLKITYLLDFGNQRYDIGDDSMYTPYKGLHRIDESPIVTEIDREGAAALFRVRCP